jgi:uncharacterized membrane protein
MLDFHTLTELSRNNCIGICAFLVPANLVFTLLTIILTLVNRSIIQVGLSAAIASLFAVVMVLHVYTWFMIGVVMLPTYILLALGVSCLVINFIAVLWRQNSLQFVLPWK